MKNIKILTLLILLSGVGTAYSQQSTVVQKNDQKSSDHQADRASLSPAQAPNDINLQGGSASPAPAIRTTAEPIADELCPDRPSSRTSADLSRATPEADKNTDYQVSLPSDPNAVRPDTK